MATCSFVVMKNRIFLLLLALICVIKQLQDDQNYLGTYICSSLYSIVSKFGPLGLDQGWHVPGEGLVE